MRTMIGSESAAAHVTKDSILADYLAFLFEQFAVINVYELGVGTELLII